VKTSVTWEERRRAAGPPNCVAENGRAEVRRLHKRRQAPSALRRATSGCRGWRQRRTAFSCFDAREKWPTKTRQKWPKAHFLGIGVRRRCFATT